MLMMVNDGEFHDQNYNIVMGGVSINTWFTMENPHLKWMMTGGYPYFRKLAYKLRNIMWFFLGILFSDKAKWTVFKIPLGWLWWCGLTLSTSIQYYIGDYGNPWAMSHANQYKGMMLRLLNTVRCRMMAIWCEYHGSATLLLCQLWPMGCIMYEWD